MPHPTSPATFVVVDLEFTTWPDALVTDWAGPGRRREIVQIGALRLDARCTVVEEYEALVKPVANPRLSPFFTELTGIDQHTVDREGLEPAQALGDFLGFCRGQSVLSYGNDMMVLAENTAWARARGEEIKNGFLDPAFLNIRPWLNTLAPATATANSGRLWQALDLPRPAEGAEHSALFDCYSLAAALGHLHTLGHPLPPGCVRPTAG
ncbi:exonuclease domain-containing protein [Streptomyces sp. NPDC050560]|uniref:exonuclease domain-containing protein n=1 Tax=Streptomyces sp. NPDC050560 TaxID=3365630 RepID=UPI0037A724C4